MLLKKDYEGGLLATLIQDQEQMRNHDSRNHLPGFVRFNLIPQFLCGDFFNSIGHSRHSRYHQPAIARQSRFTSTRPLGFRFARGIELIEAIGPICLVRFIANVDPRPPTANEISGLQDGPYRGNPKECRMNAVRVVAVDRK
jgi:hypothetical protein